MPLLGVVFELETALTQPGETIRVIGHVAEMGSWQPGKGSQDAACQMRTSPLTYPRWLVASPIWIEDSRDYATDLVLEYKYVKIGLGGAVQWEGGSCNRQVVLSHQMLASHILIVSDDQWGLTEVSAKVSYSSLQDLIANRREVDPDWTHRGLSTARAPIMCGILPQLQLEGSSFPSTPSHSICNGLEADSPGETDSVKRYRQDTAASIVKQIEAPQQPKEDEVEALKRENAALRAALRCVAEPQQDAPSTRLSNASTTAPRSSRPRLSLPADCPRPSSRNAEEVRAASTNSAAQLSLEGFHWDWPLSRSEKKQRLLLADLRLQAIQDAEILQHVVEETDAVTTEMALETEALKNELQKLRSSGVGVGVERPAALRGGA
eukprot:gb/GFBE01075333.1/.p1 GENE.gb/GFBE01075333.1/~~gb/GFBE01075333.1/.p1  ORF type:complete len:379 (+),score=71.66 gb/GFBE01075333.1/:1-1137(+)